MNRLTKSNPLQIVNSSVPSLQPVLHRHREALQAQLLQDLQKRKEPPTANGGRGKA
jgi:hypothetical protein